MKMDFEQIEIETPRLILRAPRMEDAQEIQAEKLQVWNNLRLWMSWAYAGQETLEATKAYIAGGPDNVAAGGMPLVAFDKESGRFALSTGFSMKGDFHETGYWVAKDFLGKGLAAEATNAAIRYAFAKLNPKAIFICHFQGNDKSRRIIEKLGFAKTGVLEKYHARCLDGELLDEHQYEMRDPSVLPALDVQWRVRCP